MNFFCIKFAKDRDSFNFARVIGMKVLELEKHEEVDERIDELVKNNCKNIILSNEVAGFSEDIIKKYSNDKDIKIYIAPSKRV